MAFAQSMIQSLTTRTNGEPLCEIEFIRTRDRVTVAAAVQTPAHVIHITAHGDTDPDDLGFWSDDEETFIGLSGLAEQFVDDGQGIEAAVLFADCCRSGTGRFVRSATASSNH